MTALAPLEALLETDGGRELALPPALSELYGRLALGETRGRPYVVGNFVTTLDGVVSLEVPGQTGGGEISGYNQHDRMVMGLLRSIADAVVVGAGTLRGVPNHLWTSEFIYPELAQAYRDLRTSLGRSEPPLNVIVTGSGDLDLDLPVFRSGAVPVLVVTTHEGTSRLRGGSMPPRIRTVAVKESGTVEAAAVLEAVGQQRDVERVLVEGGPQLMGDFLSEGLLDELFLTLAPQIAGRDGSVVRPGLVAGRLFAPDSPLWGELVGVKRGGSHLFLRYAFKRG